MPVSASLQKKSLSTETIALNCLGSRVWVSPSFQIFALTAGGNVLGREGKYCPGGRNVRGNMSEGNVQGTNVLHWPE